MNRPALPRSTGHLKLLWVVLAALGLAVLAMGVMLIHNQNQPAQAAAVVWSGAAPKTPGGNGSAVPDAASTPYSAARPEAIQTQTPAVDRSRMVQHPTFEATNVPQAKTNSKHAATKLVAIEGFQPSSSPRSVQPRHPEPAVARPGVVKGEQANGASFNPESAASR